VDAWLFRRGCLPCIAVVTLPQGGVRKAADILESELRIGSDHLRTTDAMVRALCCASEAKCVVSCGVALQLAWHQRTMLDVACVYVAFMLVIACVRSNTMRDPFVVTCAAQLTCCIAGFPFVRSCCRGFVSWQALSLLGVGWGAEGMFRNAK